MWCLWAGVLALIFDEQKLFGDQAAGFRQETWKTPTEKGSGSEARKSCKRRRVVQSFWYFSMICLLRKILEPLVFPCLLRRVELHQGGDKSVDVVVRARPARRTVDFDVPDGSSCEEVVTSRLIRRMTSVLCEQRRLMMTLIDLKKVMVLSTGGEGA
jgi:hypothetical protein